MTGGIRCVVFVVLTFLLSLARGEVEVSCVFMQSCILPCSFQGGADVVIHWIQVTTGDTTVHSYYHNEDQLTHQGQNFGGRTSLFKDQISRGNASLQLTGVQVQDQGRYKCYTSTIRGNNELFINLKVDDAAPVNPTSALPTPTEHTDEEDKDPPAEGQMQDNILIAVVVVVAVIVVLAVGGLAAFCIYKKTNVCKKGRETTDQTESSDQTELQELTQNKG